MDGRHRESAAERRARVEEYVTARNALWAMFRRMQEAGVPEPAEPVPIVVERIAVAMLAGGVEIEGQVYRLVAIDGVDVEKPRSG